ncbi:MAG: Bax inhibitor-1/YccA family protein [Bacteroidia bacterium]
MDTNSGFNFNISEPAPIESGAMSKTFLASVFSWMFFALVTTGVVAYLFGHSASLLQMLITNTGMTPLGYIVMFAPIGFVLLMSFGINKLSYPVLLLLFIAFSILMGMSLSFIFLAYTGASIASIFFVSAGMFGLMGIVGYTTSTDLTKFGSLMFMGLIGIIIASVVNIFMKSSGMDYLISFLAVLIFTGLTAYDVQKLKKIGSTVENGTDSAAKLAIFGALSLYLDFINLFLALLRIFGGRK